MDSKLKQGDAYHKWRMCTRKKTFYTQSKALKHTRKQRHGQWKTYECPYCYTWHIAKDQGT